MIYSPLRYPGGKAKLSKFIAKVCTDNQVNGHYIEPYAGGAAVALYLLLKGNVSKITINDYDRSIYAFWYSVLNHTDSLCNMISDTEVNMKNWNATREIQSNKQKAGLLELGFSTFFQNRTNMSGIIKAGVIGGKKQNGKYKINCRFNKKALIKRVKDIAIHKENIDLYNLDAAELIKKIQKESHGAQTIFYCDPPYYLKGASLYTNHYHHDDHKEISKLIKSIENIHWIVSYDDTPEIENIYQWVNNQNRIKYSLTHNAYKAKKGREVMYLSDSLTTIPKFRNIMRM